MFKSKKSMKIMVPKNVHTVTIGGGKKKNICIYTDSA